LKIAPDLSLQQLDDIIEIVVETKIDGVIATNTTVERNNLKSDKSKVEKTGSGGLSGKPLTGKSTEVIKYLSEKSNHRFPIIGVGGIMNENDAKEKLNSGASLIQIYSGFIYGGPLIVKKINQSMINPSE
jgi:dihydroorotate dehydrogenase